MEECVGALIWFYTSPNGPEEVLAMITAADSVHLLWERPPWNCCRVEAGTLGKEGVECAASRGETGGAGCLVICQPGHMTRCSVRSEVFLLPWLPKPSPTARENGCLGQHVGWFPPLPQSRADGTAVLPKVNVFSNRH